MPGTLRTAHPAPVLITNYSMLFTSIEGKIVLLIAPVVRDEPSWSWFELGWGTYLIFQEKFLFIVLLKNEIIICSNERKGEFGKLLLYCRQGRTTSLFYSYKEKSLAQQRACRNSGPVARMAEMKEYPFSLGITDILRIRVLVEKLL